MQGQGRRSYCVHVVDGGPDSRQSSWPSPLSPGHWFGPSGLGGRIILWRGANHTFHHHTHTWMIYHSHTSSISTLSEYLVTSPCVSLHACEDMFRRYFVRYASLRYVQSVNPSPSNLSRIESSRFDPQSDQVLFVNTFHFVLYQYAPFLLSISSPHGSVAYGDEQNRVKSLATLKKVIVVCFLNNCIKKLYRVMSTLPRLGVRRPHFSPSDQPGLRCSGFVF